MEIILANILGLIVMLLLRLAYIASFPESYEYYSKDPETIDIRNSLSDSSRKFKTRLITLILGAGYLIVFSIEYGWGGINQIIPFIHLLVVTIGIHYYGYNDLKLWKKLYPILKWGAIIVIISLLLHFIENYYGNG